MDMILSIKTMFPINPMPPIAWVRLLRLLPALSSSATLMFVLDEHLIFGTWAHPSLQKQANAHLPAWWTKGGLRWRWVLILFYPMNYTLGILNLVVTTDRHPDSTKWYMLGLGFSIAHMFFIRWALGLIADIGNNVPKGNVRRSMAGWLRMNWIRGLTTDLPAWLCFITAALKAL